ncbi:MAG: fumarylacetoacetate hydrolase family protein [Alphaproteobacteria bacterium]
MRLLRYRHAEGFRPGLLDAAGTIRDLSGHVPDIGGDVLSPAGLARVAALDPATLSAVPEAALGPPIAGIGKIIGVGLNYRDHAAETGLALPKEPTLFLKATSALAGPADPTPMPRGAKAMDWEVELGVVIGDAAAYVPIETAMDHVAGYVLGIDFSERDFQFNRGGQGFKGKSADGFAPLGPWLVTSDAVPDAGDLRLRLWVNGTLRQDGTTRELIFPVSELVSYISGFMSLQPGDVILTGTPAGVGLGMKPPAYLAAGDEVVAEINGLGRQAHRIVAGA